MGQQLNFESLPQLAIAEGATTPNPGISGVLVYSTTLSKPIWWNGSAWSSSFGAGLTNPMTTAGDMIVAAAMGAAGRLPIGPFLSKLVSDGVTANWIGPNSFWEMHDEMFASGSWTVNATGSGSAVSRQGTSSAGAPGVANGQIGSSGWSSLAIFGGSGGVDPIILGGGPLVVETRIRHPTLSNSTDRYAFFFGLSNASIGYESYTANIGLLYSDNVNSGKYQCLAKTSSAGTTGDSGVTVAASSTTWTKLSVVINAAGNSATYFINGTQVGSPITTNFPSGGVAPYLGGPKVSGSGTVQMWQCDYAYAGQILTTPR